MLLINICIPLYSFVFVIFRFHDVLWLLVITEYLLWTIQPNIISNSYCQYCSKMGKNNLIFFSVCSDWYFVLVLSKHVVRYNLLTGTRDHNRDCQAAILFTVFNLRSTATQFFAHLMIIYFRRIINKPMRLHLQAFLKLWRH